MLLTAIALIAFAGNSLLNRAALADGGIDAGSFTVLRLVSGAMTLALLMLFQRQQGLWPPLFLPTRSDAAGGMALLVYAACFSFAYIGLEAGTGALLLFTSVQLTMQVIAALRGNRPRPIQLVGLMLAIAGLFWLLGPGASPPPLGAALLMVISGAAWGVYSSLGLTGGNPARATARNFLFAAPLSFFVLLVLPIEITVHGAALAVAAGAITSALGYVIWYAALPGLSAATAGVAQLLVPSIAALGGMLFLDEAVSSRLLLATALIMLGIALTMWKGKATS